MQTLVDLNTHAKACFFFLPYLSDTSGSMSDEIEAVKGSCQNFADKIIKENRDMRLGLVGFDIGGHYKSGDRQNYIIHTLSRYTIEFIFNS